MKSEKPKFEIRKIWFLDRRQLAVGSIQTVADGLTIYEAIELLEYLQNEQGGPRINFVIRADAAQ